MVVGEGSYIAAGRYLPGYSAHILTYAYVFGYFPYVDTGVWVP